MDDRRKDICNDCVYAVSKTVGTKKCLCPFCRAPPASTHEVEIKRLHKVYANGLIGVRQDWTKANELFLKAGELGCALAMAYYNLGNCYTNEGRGVAIDTKKAKHYL